MISPLPVKRKNAYLSALSGFSCCLDFLYFVSMHSLYKHHFLLDGELRKYTPPSQPQQWPCSSVVSVSNVNASLCIYILDDVESEAERRRYNSTGSNWRSWDWSSSPLDCKISAADSRGFNGVRQCVALSSWIWRFKWISWISSSPPLRNAAVFIIVQSLQAQEMHILYLIHHHCQSLLSSCHF